MLVDYCELISGVINLSSCHELMLVIVNCELMVEDMSHRCRDVISFWGALLLWTTPQYVFAFLQGA